MYKVLISIMLSEFLKYEIENKLGSVMYILEYTPKYQNFS